MFSPKQAATIAAHQQVPSVSLPSEFCISVETLVDRLARARASVENHNVLLAFDADGTLWSGDVGNDLFYELIASQAVRPAAHEALVREAEACGIACTGNATDIAKMLFDACEAGQYSEERCFAMMAWAFAGIPLTDAIEVAKRVAAETKLENRLHRFLDPVFDWARREHVPVWIVSASPKWMVEIGAAMFDIPKEQVIGMAPVIENGFVMPKLASVPIYGPNKPLVLREMCPQGTLLGGFGDSSYDVPLLQMARVPVAVRPKPSLVAHMHAVPNIVAVGVEA